MSYKESLNFFHNSTTIAATQVKLGPGVLHTVAINTIGATPGVITIADGTPASNTVIAVITPVTNSTVTPTTALYDVRYTTGLVLTATGSTQDITLSFDP